MFDSFETTLFRLFSSDRRSLSIRTSTATVCLAWNPKKMVNNLTAALFSNLFGYSGHICLSILTDDWSPALSIFSVCVSIISMLSSCKEKVSFNCVKKYIFLTPSLIHDYWPVEETPRWQYVRENVQQEPKENQMVVPRWVWIATA